MLVLTLLLAVGFFYSTRPLGNELATKKEVYESNLFENKAGGYTFAVPAGWSVEIGAGDPSSTALRPAGKLPNPEQHYYEDILISVVPNPQNLTLAEFYAKTSDVTPIDLFTYSETQTPLVISGGIEAILFHNVLGFFTSTILSVRANNRVIEIADVEQAHQRDGIFDALISSFVVDLPPDPGEAGKATVKGIDSNNNGVRDDVERWIAFTFQDAKTRSTLTQAARALERTISSSNGQEAQQSGQDLDSSIACLDARLGALVARDVYGELFGVVFNTELRVRANQTFRSRVQPGLFPEEYPNDGCI